MQASGERHQNPLLFIAIFLVLALGSLAVVVASRPSTEPATSTPPAADAQGSGGNPGQDSKFDCPRGTPQGFALADVEGKELSQVESWAKGQQLTVRVQVKDGKPMALTMDYRPDRVNVQVEAGVVTRYCGNG